MKKILLTIFMVLTGHTAIHSMFERPTSEFMNISRNACFALVGQPNPAPLLQEYIDNIQEAILENTDNELLKTFLNNLGDIQYKQRMLTDLQNNEMLRKSGKIGFEKLIDDDNQLTPNQKIHIKSTISNIAYLALAQNSLYFATQRKLQNAIKKANDEKFDKRALTGFIAFSLVILDHIIAAHKATPENSIMSKYIGPAIATCIKDSNPNHIMGGCAATLVASAIGFNNIQNYVLSPTWNKLTQLYNWMKQHPKETAAGLVTTLLANWAIRGEKALIVHCYQHGPDGVVSATFDQISATTYGILNACAPLVVPQQPQPQRIVQKVQKIADNVKKTSNNTFQDIGKVTAGAAALFAAYKGRQAYKGAKNGYRSAKAWCKSPA